MGGLYTIGYGSSVGGAVNLSQTNLELSQSSVRNNSTLASGDPWGDASTTGGGLYVGWKSALVAEGLVVTGNKMDSQKWSYGGGIYLYYCEGSSSQLMNSILAYNSLENLACGEAEAASAPVFFSDLYNPPGEGNYDFATLDSSNLTVEPAFLAYDEEGLPLDLHLAGDSPLVNAGEPDADYNDVDGSRSDLGIYGGPEGDRWNRDGDGYRDYFWPGALEDAPAGFDPAEYDLDDGDAAVH